VIAPLDSRQLMAFSTLARVGSFKVAGTQLSVSGSAISHSIRELEQQIGCRLVDRDRKKVTLTQAGEQLLHHCNKILDEMSLAKSSIEHLGNWGRERLRVCASGSLCQHALPAVVQEFSKEYPRIRILLEQADSPEALELLRSNRVDLAITLEPRSEPLLEFRPLFIDSLQFLVRPDHPWAKIGHATRGEIHRQRYILYRRTSSTVRMIEEYFSADQIVLDTVMEVGNMDSIKELVHRGLGISIVAPWIAATESELGTFVCLPLGSKPLQRSWGLLHWQGRPFTLVQETFADLCGSMMRRLNDSGLAESLGKPARRLRTGSKAGRDAPTPTTI